MFSASFLARKQIIIYLDRALEGMQKHDLEDLVVEALKALGGSGTIVDVAREIWIHHEAELRSSGDLFFTWQYDISLGKKASQGSKPRTSGKVRTKISLDFDLIELSI